MKYPLVAILLLAGLTHVVQAASDADSTGALAASGPARPAAVNPPRARAQNVIAIEAGSGRVIQLAGSAATVFAADPKVAEVRPASATSLFIFGVAPGRTDGRSPERKRCTNCAIRCRRPTFQLRRKRGGSGRRARTAGQQRAR